MKPGQTKIAPYIWAGKRSGFTVVMRRSHKAFYESFATLAEAKTRRDEIDRKLPKKLTGRPCSPVHTKD